jgi:hypothetical protein
MGNSTGGKEIPIGFILQMSVTYVFTPTTKLIWGAFTPVTFHSVAGEYFCMPGCNSIIKNIIITYSGSSMLEKGPALLQGR